MKKVFRLLALVILFSFASSCNQKIDIEKEKVEIRKVLSDGYAALVNKDIDALLSSDTQESYGVTRGKITKNTQEDSRKDFEAQFKNGKYSDVNDIIEPIIKISTDGKMAWVIAQTSFTFISIDSNGLEKSYNMVDAYLQILVKEKDKWLLSDIAQTFDK